MFREPSAQKQLPQRFEHITGTQASGNHDLQTLSRILIDDNQDPYDTAIDTAHHDKVIAPYVISMKRPQPHAGSITQPQPASLRLPLRHFKTLLSPQSFYSLMIHLPAFPAQ
jgi:hypothetical protein